MAAPVGTADHSIVLCQPQLPSDYDYGKVMLVKRRVTGQNEKAMLAMELVSGRRLPGSFIYFLHINATTQKKTPASQTARREGPDGKSRLSKSALLFVFWRMEKPPSSL